MIDGERHLIDFDHNIAYPESVLHAALKDSVGMISGSQSAAIDDVSAYIESRLQPFADRLLSTESSGHPTDQAEEHEFVILSLDIVRSTQMAATMNQNSYARLIVSVLQELSEVIPKYNGFVLKFTGDGIIAYFPAPSFITMNDLALCCAIVLLRLTNEVIIPALNERSLPTIDIRIGLDSGKAYVAMLGSSVATQQPDIIGYVVNLATKIQGQALPGEIRIGEETEKHLHTGWRGICEPAVVATDWSYEKPCGHVYRVFRIKC